MNRIVPAVAICAALCSPPCLAAQNEAAELERRLEDLERLVRVLQSQVAEQSGSGIAPRSGNFLELSGLVLMNAFGNTNPVFMDDVPQWVMRDGDGADCSQCHQGAAASIRQTRLTLTAFATQVLGAEFTGELDLDFFGGQPHTTGGRTFPNMRIRRTRAGLSWRHVSLVVGQDAPPIAELNPSSLAALGFPGFVGAGNLWLWLPQVRVRVHTAGSVRYGIEVAALGAADGQVREELFYNMPDRAERSSRPFLQGRVVASWGEGDAGGEVGFGGHLGWLEEGDSALVQTKAVAASARMLIGGLVELRAEAFTGQALQTLGGGGAYQNFGAGRVPLRTKGGWFQVNFLPNPRWEFGGGAGVDDPDETQFGPGRNRARNQSYEVHAMWRLSPIQLGLEIRRMKTTEYRTNLATYETTPNTHFNLALGFEF